MEEKISKSKQILNFVIKTMNGMAYGLFATLIVGTILATIGGFFKDSSYIGQLLITVAKFLQNMTGIGIGLGIAWSMKFDGLKLIAITAVGAIASYLNINIYNPEIQEYRQISHYPDIWYRPYPEEIIFYFSAFPFETFGFWGLSGKTLENSTF